MKRKEIAKAYIAFIFILFGNCAQKDEFPVLKGPYLGQKPPGMTPEVFAPGVVSTKENSEYGGHLSPDGKEFYFTRHSPQNRGRIFFMKSKSERWSNPRQVSFMNDYPGVESCLSPDGHIFYYVWYDEKEETFIHDFYTVERIEPGWGNPHRLTNTDLGERRICPSVSRNGTLYFSGNYDKPDNKDIYLSHLINGIYEAPINLGLMVNSDSNEEHVYVSPDESYIIFDSYRSSGYGRADLYVSYRLNDGTWSEAQNLGTSVNSVHGDWYPSITPDGKYLMFARSIHGRNIDIYWVDAKIIEEFKPK